MSTLTIVLLIVGGLLGLAVIAYAAFFIRTLRATAKPIPIDTRGFVRLAAGDVPLAADGPEPAMDVWVPADAPPSDAPRPVVLLVPGDGPDWLLRKAKGWGLFRSYAELCAARGWVTVVTNHRSSGSYKRTPGMVQDVRSALERLRERAEDLGLDPERVVVWTFSGSAGPILSELISRPVPGVRGLMSFYGFLDLAQWPLRVPADVVETYSLPRVLPGLEALPCPVYLLHAGKDRKPMTKGFDATRQALEGRDLPVTLRVGVGLRHGFEVLDVPALSEPEILAGLAFAERCLSS